MHEIHTYTKSAGDWSKESGKSLIMYANLFVASNIIKTVR